MIYHIQTAWGKVLIGEQNLREIEALGFTDFTILEEIDPYMKPYDGLKADKIIFDECQAKQEVEQKYYEQERKKSSSYFQQTGKWKGKKR